MCINHALGDGQPQPVASVAADFLFLTPRKRLKKLVRHRFGNPRPLVADGNEHVLAFAPGLKPHGGAGSGVLNGIAQQVHGRQFDLEPIHLHGK